MIITESVSPEGFAVLQVIVKYLAYIDGLKFQMFQRTKRSLSDELKKKLQLTARLRTSECLKWL